MIGTATAEHGFPFVCESRRREYVHNDVESRLRRSGYLALRDVTCEVQAGIARLRGRLPSYYLKQMAQAIVADVEGVRRVVNLIEVVVPSSRPSQGHDRSV
jgi:osmotically-inducible protein OsmY